MTTCRSEGKASLPFRSASMIRRQISTVAVSPRSLAASRTSQAASAGDRSSRSSPEARRSEEFMSCPCLLRMLLLVDREPRLAAGAGLGGVGLAARLIEFENALRGRDVEPAEFAFEIG